MKKQTPLFMALIVFAIIFILGSMMSCQQSTGSIIHPSELDGFQIVSIEAYFDNTIKVAYWDMSDTTRNVCYVDNGFYRALKESMGKTYYYE